MKLITTWSCEKLQNVFQDDYKCGLHCDGHNPLALAVNENAAANKIKFAEEFFISENQLFYNKINPKGHFSIKPICEEITVTRYVDLEGKLKYILVEFGAFYNKKVELHFNDFIDNQWLTKLTQMGLEVKNKLTRKLKEYVLKKSHHNCFDMSLN